MPSQQIDASRASITGLVLAGGQGSRMGGVDKGLQLLGGKPLAQWCAERLAPQVGPVLVNANRHADAYAALGCPVVADLALEGAEAYPGPLAGFAAGLAACSTPWLLTVACDTPFFPQDLAARLLQAAVAQKALVAMACTAPDAGSDTIRPLPQPTFCLLHRSLAASAQQFMAQGGRKIRQWTDQHAHTTVVFGDASAFYNANTPEELAWLQTQAVQHLRN